MGRIIETEEFQGFPDSPVSDRAERPTGGTQDPVTLEISDNEDVQDGDEDGDPATAENAQDGSDDEEEEDIPIEMLEEIMIDAINQQEDSSDEEAFPPPVEDDGLTKPEAATIRTRLHKLGPRKFVEQLIEKGPYMPERIIKALGVRIPEFVLDLEGAVYDQLIQQLLNVAIRRELMRRPKLTDYNSVTDAVQLISRSRNIMVVTGAGISTSLGIPDFRSKGTGLYSQLAARGYSDPTDVFDIDVFKQDPTLFYSVAKDILPSTKRFTPTHAFIAELDRRSKLLTNYTQNIDNIESAAGISADRLVQCHGSFRTATCFTCGFKVPGEDVFDDIKAGKIPDCQSCLREAAAAAAAAAKRKRASGADGNGRKTKRRNGGGDWPGGSGGSGNGDDEHDDDGPNLKIMKPDITFFGEALPDLFHDRLTQHDLDKVDLLVVIGTSLKVKPVSEISSIIPGHIPQIYISRDPIDHINFDIVLLGDCDVVVADLARRLGWDFRHEMVPRDQEVRVERHDMWEHWHQFRKTWPLPMRTPVAAVGGGVIGGDAGGVDSGVKVEEDRSIGKNRPSVLDRMPPLVQRGGAGRHSSK